MEDVPSNEHQIIWIEKKPFGNGICEKRELIPTA